MINVTERQKNILEKVIQEYIKNALPVSSKFLKQKCRLDISPATIRLDFGELTQAGFLKKSYISGGRVPTDKGYRFFVDNLFEKGCFAQDKKRIFKKFQEVFKEIDDVFRFSREIAKNLAVSSSNFAVSYFQDFNVFWKEGWDEILQEPEFHNFDYLRKFTELINDLEENVEKLDFVEKNKKIKVYIGKESPFRRKEFSIIVGRSSNPEKRAIFAILGPKRMNFKKNINLINCLISQVENFTEI